MTITQATTQPENMPMFAERAARRPYRYRLIRLGWRQARSSTRGSTRKAFIAEGRLVPGPAVGYRVFQ
jgi:hypothetical protein